MKLFKVSTGAILLDGSAFYRLDIEWDELINRSNLYYYLANDIEGKYLIDPNEAFRAIENLLLAPIGLQEVWAAGVTYLRSREARMEESADSGAADLYDKVYAAERPELFFKSLAHRVAGHGQQVYIRRDSTWSVPEPELTLYINSAGEIQGYTVGNDMSSRSIEGENALYLPQAKIYERSAALGPCLLVPQQPLAAATPIRMSIKRNGIEVYVDETNIGRMKRTFTELAQYLYRECDFSYGCYLMTGTCLVPPNDFTLNEGDVVSITIDPVGTLVNTVIYKPSNQHQL